LHGFHLQLKDSHPIQIFKVIPLGSQVIFDLLSAGFSAPGHTLQNIFPHCLVTDTIFGRNIFCLKICFDFLYNISLKDFYYKKREKLNKKIHKSSFSEPFFLSGLHES